MVMASLACAGMALPVRFACVRLPAVRSVLCSLDASIGVWAHGAGRRRSKRLQMVVNISLVLAALLAGLGTVSASLYNTQVREQLM